MIISTVDPVSAPVQKKKHIGFFIFLFVCLLLLAGIGFILFRVLGFAHTVFKSEGVGSDIAALLPSNVSDVQKSLNDGKSVNILLLGYGGVGHDGAYLTDSMMVVSINPQEKNVGFISIPRDMWVKIPIAATYASHGKINSVYEIGLDDVNYQDRLDKYKGKYGGGTMAKDVISNVLGIPIDYFVGINFDGFKSIVDDLGGVDIVVDHTLDDYQYPSGDENVNGPNCVAPMNTKTTCKFWHVHFDPGLHHMDGQTALEYARSRHAVGSEGSDFARSARQQKLMLAIRSKALKIDALPKVLDVMSSLQGSVLTDLNIADIKDLSNDAKAYNLDNPVRDGLTDQNVLMDSYSSDGQYILIPRKGMDDYSGVYTYIQQMWLRNKLQTEEKTGTVEVLNSTTRPLLAASAAQNLTDLGMQASSSARRPATDYPATIIYDYSNGKYPNMLDAIKTEVGGTVQKGTPDMNPDSDIFVIVLGDDYQAK